LSRKGLFIEITDYIKYLSIKGCGDKQA